VLDEANICEPIIRLEDPTVRSAAPDMTFLETAIAPAAAVIQSLNKLDILCRVGSFKSTSRCLAFHAALWKSSHIRKPLALRQFHEPTFTLHFCVGKRGY